VNIVTKYLFFKYLKFFIIVMLSLEIFFVGISFLQNFKSLPQSANLQFLYLVYDSIYTLTIVVPLSLVFSWIVLIINLIKTNEFVAFYSLGLKKEQILKPILALSFLITFSVILIQSTPLAYAEQQKSKILKGEYFTNTKENLFLKYNDYFIYFKKLYPLEQRAQGINIYRVKNGDLIEIIEAKAAYFKDDKWNAIDAKITSKPINLNWETSKLNVKYEQSIYTLEGFKPKILDNVYTAKSMYSISDAIQAFFLIIKQDLDTSIIRNTIYYNMLVPFFVLPTIVLIFIYSSISNRFFQVNKFTAIALSLVLTLWGILFFLNKLSSGGVLLPEISLLIPLVILYIVSYKLYLSKKDSL
jgi:lipopolysaccharide export system permease protein